MLDELRYMDTLRSFGVCLNVAAVLVLLVDLLVLGETTDTDTAVVKGDDSGLEYQVGGCRGWDNGIDFKKWAFEFPVHVGDSLVFRYRNKTGHSVLSLRSEDDMDRCNTSNPLNEWAYEDAYGGSKVALDRVGTLYLVCSGWCNKGMKVEINVKPRPQTVPALYPPRKYRLSGTPAEPQGLYSSDSPSNISERIYLHC